MVAGPFHPPAWRSLAGLCALVVLLAGCTYAEQEPGLFRQTDTQTSETTEPNRLPPRKTNPALPVAGEAIWTTAEGLRVTVRFAVHAIRRIEGAAVLDWSVTPLSAPKLRTGERLPGRVDLGLTSPAAGDGNIVLSDAAGRVYRQLTHVSRAEFNRCLCSPIWATQLGLRLGETRMLQLTFPELPPEVEFLDVSLANVPTFWHVPVSPLGQAPRASRSTNLGRPADRVKPVATPQPFSFPWRKGRLQNIEIRQIVASPTSTSLEWTINSYTDQPSISLIAYGPPVAAAAPEGVLVVSQESASGPQIRASNGSRGPLLKARWMTARVQGTDFYECLCTPIGIWAASLRQSGGAATVTTTFAPLPANATKADVVLPGVATLRDLAVVRAPDAAARLGNSVKVHTRYWTYDVNAPPNGWSTWDWPTPTPDPDQLRSYNSFVEKIVPLPGQ
jgi:hypothetical protein